MCTCTSCFTDLISASLTSFQGGIGIGKNQEITFTFPYNHAQATCDHLCTFLSLIKCEDALEKSITGVSPINHLVKIFCHYHYLICMHEFLIPARNSPHINLLHCVIRSNAGVLLDQERDLSYEGTYKNYLLLELCGLIIVKFLSHGSSFKAHYCLYYTHCTV